LPPAFYYQYSPNIRHGENMKTTFPLFLLLVLIGVSACAPKTTASPTQTPVPVVTDAPTAVTATDVADEKQYTNDAFKFRFKYPSNWFGPDEYISDNTLRLAVGSDVVYPYGEVPETPSDVKNSYLVVIQYTKNATNTVDLYQTLEKMKDGESTSGARGLLTRVRALQVGRFDGFEYISTVSATAQTEYFYTRNVLLLDKQTNDLITIIAQPNNVEVPDLAKRADLYQSIDAANLPMLYKIIESITAE
jgi:hypothetical protein